MALESERVFVENTVSDDLESRDRGARALSKKNEGLSKRRMKVPKRTR